MRIQRSSMKCKNFQTAEAHHNNCRQKVLGECKGLKYYNNQHLMVIELKISVAVQKIIITVV